MSVKKKTSLSISDAHYILDIRKTFPDSSDKDFSIAMAFDFEEEAFEYGKGLALSLVEKQNLTANITINVKYKSIFISKNNGEKTEWNCAFNVRPVLGKGSSVVRDIVLM